MNILKVDRYIFYNLVFKNYLNEKNILTHSSTSTICYDNSSNCEIKSIIFAMVIIGISM